MRYLQKTFFYLPVFLCIVIFSGACSSTPSSKEGKVTITFVNESAQSFVEVYISKPGKEDWKKLELSEDLREFAEVPVVNIAPGKYDLKLVDDAMEVCYLRDVDFSTEKKWTIEQEALVDCEVRKSKQAL